MKLKLLKFIIPCLASLTCLSGCNNNSVVDPEEQNEITRYYGKYDLTLSGVALEKELQKLCFNTHTVYVKYSQFNSYCGFTADRISIETAASTLNDSTKKNEYFYTGKIATGFGTREHVWPCANSGELWTHGDDNKDPHNVDSSTYKGGGSDLYHVRTCTTSVNTARGNSKFCDFDDDEFEAIRGQVAEVGEKNGQYKLKIQGFETTSSGTMQFAKKAEPADEFKGDIARILVYVWIHYAYRGGVDFKGHDNMVGPLDLTNVLAYGSDFDRTTEKLLEWNKMDPPSETEKLRNKTVQKIQGNRNPFVDHPELMDQLF